MRVWNLVEKGEIFEKLVQPEVAMRIVDQVIGDDFCLGSFAANFLQPGAGAQKPHLDYPYWDYVNGHGMGTGAWPSGCGWRNKTEGGRKEIKVKDILFKGKSKEQRRKEEK